MKKKLVLRDSSLECQLTERESLEFNLHLKQTFQNSIFKLTKYNFTTEKN